MSTNYESIPRGTFLGTFEPVDEEISEIHITSWTKLEVQMCQAHTQKGLTMCFAESFKGGEGISRSAARIPN